MYYFTAMCIGCNLYFKKYNPCRCVNSEDCGCCNTCITSKKFCMCPNAFDFADFLCFQCNIRQINHVKPSKKSKKQRKQSKGKKLTTSDFIFIRPKKDAGNGNIFTKLATYQMAKTRWKIIRRGSMKLKTYRIKKQSEINVDFINKRKTSELIFSPISHDFDFDFE